MRSKLEDARERLNYSVNKKTRALSRETVK